MSSAYDYVVVGAGLFGATFARQMADVGRRVLVLEKRPHVGGNCYDEVVDGIRVCRHGGHIFHCNDDRIWQYVNRFADFVRYEHRVKVNYKNQVYSFPINLMTMQQIFGSCISSPELARQTLDLATQIGAQTVRGRDDLEAWAISHIGYKLYKTFIEGYTTKQWGRSPSELPASIVKRLPIRLTYDDVYFSDRYQGMPRVGYTAMIARLLDGIEVKAEVDYLDDRRYWNSLARRVVYSGPVDELFDCGHGRLEYRSLRFETERLKIPDFQGCATMNYTDADVPYTRILEWKHFGAGVVGDAANHTLITCEYPAAYSGASETAYYPVPTAGNVSLASEYAARAEAAGILVGGRLGSYMYMDMHQVIGQALALAERELRRETTLCTVASTVVA